VTEGAILTETNAPPKRGNPLPKGARLVIGYRGHRKKKVRGGAGGRLSRTCTEDAPRPEARLGREERGDQRTPCPSLAEKEEKFKHLPRREEFSLQGFMRVERKPRSNGNKLRDMGKEDCCCSPPTRG